MPQLKNEVKKLNLEKDMYAQAAEAGQSFEEFLEAQDPSESYLKENGEQSELSMLSAFERQLMAYDIKVADGTASLVDSFFKTASSSVLFPEYLSQQILIGMRKGKMHAQISDMVSVTSKIEGGSFKGAEVDLDNTNVKQKRVAEGAEFPVAKIRTKDKAIDLTKFGIKIDASYESLRRMKANVLAAAMQVLGMRIAQDVVGGAVDALINGDGNSNPAGNVNTATSTEVTYADILALFMSADEGFEFDSVVASKSVMEKILTIAEFRDPLIASQWLTKGEITTPLGMKLKVSDQVPANKILAFNKTAGIEMLEERGAQLVEAHKIIDRQIEGSVVSKVSGFSKLFKNSAKVMSVVWS